MTTQVKPPKFVPSVAEYVAAFKKIEKEVTRNRRKMLINHYNSSGHVTTASALAGSVGFENYRGANLQYGTLAVLLAEALGLEWKGISVLVLFVRKKAVSNADWLLVMRQNVAEALEQLGWVKKNSDLFFPRGYHQDDVPPGES